jgi:signal peptidase I
VILPKPLGSTLQAVLRLPAVYHLLALLLARRVVVRGWSMYPTLAPGEYVLFDSLAYRLGTPHRGDIVLALHPTRPRHRIVKRVVAVPGDRVATSDGVCWVNGVACDDAASSGAMPDPGDAGTLSHEEYFLLGDWPDASTDARHFGPVHRRALKARAWLVYWPVRRFRVVKGQERG